MSTKEGQHHLLPRPLARPVSSPPKARSRKTADAKVVPPEGHILALREELCIALPRAARNSCPAKPQAFRPRRVLSLPVQPLIPSRLLCGLALVPPAYPLLTEARFISSLPAGPCRLAHASARSTRVRANSGGETRKELGDAGRAAADWNAPEQP